MHSLSLLTLAFNGLEVIKTTLARDLTLKLLETVERHASGICSDRPAFVTGDAKGDGGERTQMSQKFHLFARGRRPV